MMFFSLSLKFLFEASCPKCNPIVTDICQKYASRIYLRDICTFPSSLRAFLRKIDQWPADTRKTATGDFACGLQYNVNTIMSNVINLA